MSDWASFRESFTVGWGKNEGKNVAGGLYAIADAINNLASVVKQAAQQTGEADVAVCPACGEGLECTTTRCRYFEQIPPRSLP